MTSSERPNNTPPFEVDDLAEKIDVEPTSMSSARSTVRTSKNNESTNYDVEGSSAIRTANEEKQEYPHGTTFVLLTVGLMAVVLVLALDNYIICSS